MLAFLDLKYRHIGLEYETAALAEAHATGRLPLGKLPVLVLEDGTALPESNAILCYLAEGTPWMPEDALDARPRPGLDVLGAEPARGRHRRACRLAGL